MTTSTLIARVPERAHPRTSGTAFERARVAAAAGFLAGVLLALTGFAWDVQWHTDVGPDSFFTAPHLVLYGGIAVSGIVCLAMVLLTWSAVSTHLHVKHLGWAEQEDVVMMRSGWLWQSITLARVNKIQAVTMEESPFDRRAAMAGVRVDTAGAGELSHRVAIPYLDREVAASLSQRLAGAAANVAFRW